MAAIHDNMIGVVNVKTVDRGNGQAVILKDITGLFKVSDSTEKGRFLDVNIRHNKRDSVIQLSQRDYVGEILMHFGLTDCYAVLTPFSLGCILLVANCLDMETVEGCTCAKEVMKTNYQGMVRCLMWEMLVMCPNIAHGVGPYPSS